VPVVGVLPIRFSAALGGAAHRRVGGKAGAADTGARSTAASNRAVAPKPVHRRAPGRLRRARPDRTALGVRHHDVSAWPGRPAKGLRRVWAWDAHRRPAGVPPGRPALEKRVEVLVEGPVERLGDSLCSAC